MPVPAFLRDFFDSTISDAIGSMLFLITFTSINLKSIDMLESPSVLIRMSFNRSACWVEMNSQRHVGFPGLDGSIRPLPVFDRNVLLAHAMSMR